MKIGARITLSFFIIASIIASVISIVAYTKAKTTLQKESFNKLTAIREMKAEEIEGYYQELSKEIRAISDAPSLVSGMSDLRNGFNNVINDLKINNQKLSIIDSSLKIFYEKEYLPLLNKNVDVPATLTSELSANKNARVLQHLYIANNANDVGKKYLMNASDDLSTYSQYHKKYHPILLNMLKEFGYYDVFLVDNETGNIVYSVSKEVDFGTSLIDGPFKETNLAKAFLAIKNNSNPEYVHLADFGPYHPSYNNYASFIATPIIENDVKIGALIIQIPINYINDIMTSNKSWSNVGLGKTGETYIVGEDFTLRNQSRFLIEDEVNYFKLIKKIGTPLATINKIKNTGSTIGLQEVKTKGTIAALKGEKDTEVFSDYRGVSVLSSYKPLNIPGLHWAIMSEIDEAEAFESVYSLQKSIILLFIFMLLLIFSASYILSRRITKPLNLLSKNAMQLAKGKLDIDVHVDSIRLKDEVGILALSFKKMQISIKRHINELKEFNHNLEEKIVERTVEINHQKNIVEEKNREIVDSINYAKRLQKAILPPLEKVNQLLPNSFILFKPKDIVSGDFYWLYQSKDDIYIASVDCTGHGVPGAMVSIIGANGLNRCVKEIGITQPSKILDKLVEIVAEIFETSSYDINDGMDIALCKLNLKTKTIEFAGANNPLWILRKDGTEIEEIKGDKQPVGKHHIRFPFTNQCVQLLQGDSFYIFTDGFADQFGGPKGKKLKTTSFKKILVMLNQKTMSERKEILNNEFENWRGNLEQIDDVCVVGVEV